MYCLTFCHCLKSLVSGWVRVGLGESHTRVGDIEFRIKCTNEDVAKNPEWTGWWWNVKAFRDRIVSSRPPLFEWTNLSLKLTDKSAEADCLTELGNSQDVVLAGEDEWTALKNQIVFDLRNEGMKGYSSLNDLPLRVNVMSGNESVVLQLNMYSPAAIGKAPSLVLILVTSSFGPVERERVEKSFDLRQVEVSETYQPTKRCQYQR